MMTLYLAFERIEQGRLGYQTKIKVSANAAETAPTKLGLEEGEEIALGDAVRALITKSANDMAVAIAEHEGLIRSIDSFCKYDPLPFLLTVTNGVLKSQPEAVEAYLRGWLRAVRLLKEEPEKAAAVYTDEQKSLGREVPVPVIDRALRRMRWEPELSAEIAKNSEWIMG